MKSLRSPTPRAARFWSAVDDAGEVVGVDTSNRIRSEIQAIARNCDPPVQIVAVSGDTALRELRALRDAGLVERGGVGKAAFYQRAGHLAE